MRPLEDKGPHNFAEPSPDEIRAAAHRLRQTISRPLDPEVTGRIFHELGESISGASRRRDGRWRLALGQIADEMGYSEALLALSLDALVRPLMQADHFARKVRPRRELIGFIMPGNVPGAGLHELLSALTAGCAPIVKTSSAEPVFFREVAEALRKIDASHGTDFGMRVTVFNWSRERTDLTAAMVESCDRMVVMGDDATIAQLQPDGKRHGFTSFGSRVSGAAILREAVADDAGLAAIASAVALDCALFDQRGCLSPHHIFVEGRACEFAERIATGLSELHSRLGARDLRRIGLEDGAGVRRIREAARWRMIGGAPVKLWEGPGFAWTVVFDRDAAFTLSPGLTTVYVSQFDGLAELQRRLEPVDGKLEGFALAGDEPRCSAARGIIQRMGASYISAPGAMQSPPLDWPHGGGAFLRLMLGRE
ncbi:MAG TPA: acyl-CoA reductase [Candidatus Binataceae bacterium]|nr:acyl-CoA reductase [Candidatus Binataceae bacterium]